MSLVERAAELLEKSAPTQNPASAKELPREPGNKMAPDLIERLVEQENAKPAESVSDFSPMPTDAKSVALPPTSGKTTTTLTIDTERLRQQNMTTPDGERTPVSESFRRIK